MKPAIRSKNPKDIDVKGIEQQLIQAQLSNQTSTETVTVACKLPAGFWLRVFKPDLVDEFVIGGGMKASKVYTEFGKRFLLNGFAHPQTKSPDHKIVQGFAITPGIPKDFWDLWLYQNKDSMLVKNGLIFAHSSESNTVAEAKDKGATLKSGLERLDPNKLPKGIQRYDPKADARAA